MKNVEKKKRNVKEEEIENEFVDKILKKKERKWKCNIQETWENKLIVIYSKEVVSPIILGNTFYFYLYPLFLIPPLYPTLCPNESLIWS